MAEFKNRLSYSESTAKALLGGDCLRKIWYQKYAMWGGWSVRGRPPKSQHAAEAYRLKFANTTPQWAGHLVHNAAEFALKAAGTRQGYLESIGGRAGLVEILLKRASAQIDSGLRQARDAAERGAVTNPKTTLQLVDLNAGREADERWLRDRVMGRIEALCAGDDAWTGLSKSVNVFVKALLKSDKIVSIEDLAEWKCAGMTMFTKVDLQMRGISRKSTVIIDWKTGMEAESDIDQVNGYGAWSYQSGWDEVTLLLVYLGDKTSKIVKVDAPERSSVMKSMEDRVHGFAEMMSPLLKNGNLTDNIPLEEKFVPTVDSKLCYSCPFQSLCERDGTKPV